MRQINELCKLIKNSPKIIVNMDWAEETDNFDIQRIHDIVLSLDEEELINSVSALILAEWNVLESQDDPRCFHTLENGRKVSKFPNRNDYSREPICIGFGPNPTVSTDSLSGILYYCKVEVFNKLWPIWEQVKLRKQLMENLSPSSEMQQRIANHDDLDEDFANKSNGITKEVSYQNDNDATENEVKIPHLEYNEENETLYIYGKQDNGNSIKGNKAKRGRPKAKCFEDYIMPNAPEKLMNVLEEMLRDKNGKEAASVIIAITGVWIYEPPTKSICNRFPSITSKSYEAAKNKHYGINRYTDKAKPFDEVVLEGIRSEIRQKLSLNP